MKITPLEIRQKAFEKTMRGYDKDEVTAFLVTLSQEWERLLDETKELRIKYESSEREVSKLREVESSLYKTLKTAEDTGSNMIEQANKTAELHLRETQMKAEAMLNEAKTKAKDTIEESEVTAKELVEEMEDRLKELVEDYKKLEQHRESLLSDLKRISQDTLERVERARKNTDDFNPDQYLSKAKKELKKIIFPNHEPAPAPVKLEAPREEVKQTPAAPPTPIAIPVVEAPKPVEVPVTSGATRSFFDDIS
jgi:cell division initiation protein